MPASTEVRTLEELKNALNNELNSARRYSKLTAFLGILLVAGVIIYMSWVYKNLTTLLDEKKLSHLAGSYAETAILPKLEPELENFLLNTLPGLVDEWTENAIDNLPRIRKEFVQALTKPLEEELQKTDAQMTAKLKQEIEASKARINSMLANQSPEEKKKILTREIVAIFQAHYNDEARTVIKQFQARLQQFHQDLHTILNTPDEQLSPQQRDKKHTIMLVAGTLENIMTSDASQLTEIFFETLAENLKK